MQQKRLKEILSYNPLTGGFVSLLIRRGPRKTAGTIGCLSGGYLTIMVDGKTYKAHRLAWLYMTGSLPKENIDHANGDRLDNSWCNLRLASRSQNRANSKTSSRTGLKGVYAVPGGYQAAIRHKGHRHHLGVFESKHDAHAAYKDAAYKMHGEFARV